MDRLSFFSHPFTCVLVATTLTGISAFAETPETPELSWVGKMIPNQEHRIGAEYHFMDSAGEGTLVGTGTASGYGLSLSSSRGNSYFDFVGKARFLFQSGTAVKTVDNESLTIPFQSYAADAALGIQVHLLPGFHRGIRAYIGSHFILGLAHLRLSDLPETATALYASSSGIRSGLDTVIGVEVQKNYFAELVLRGTSGNLGGFTSLSISSTAVSAGYRW